MYIHLHKCICNYRNMCMCIYIFMYIFIYTYMCKYIYIYTHIYLHTCTLIYTDIVNWGNGSVRACFASVGHTMVDVGHRCHIREKG